MSLRTLGTSCHGKTLGIGFLIYVRAVRAAVKRMQRIIRALMQGIQQQPHRANTTNATAKEVTILATRFHHLPKKKWSNNPVSGFSATKSDHFKLLNVSEIHGKERAMLKQQLELERAHHFLDVKR